MSCRLPSCTYRDADIACPVHPRLQSHSTGRIYVVEANQEKLLILEFDLDCPVCGTATIQVLGHHLRALRETIRLAFDKYPELLGEEVDTTIAARFNFAGRAGGDPSDN